jgi:hypothetical protein
MKIIFEKMDGKLQIINDPISTFIIYKYRNTFFQIIIISHSVFLLSQNSKND